MSLARTNRYRIEVARVEDGWVVRTLDPSGRQVGARACRDETEAWTYASTLRQHVYWLSEDRFRDYYQLPDPHDGGN